MIRINRFVKDLVVKLGYYIFYIYDIYDFVIFYL